MARTDYTDILRRYGVTLTADTDSPGCVAEAPMPREQAKACVRDLEAIGAEASEAPDNDDRTVSWLYVTPPAD